MVGDNNLYVLVVILGLVIFVIGMILLSLMVLISLLGLIGVFMVIGVLICIGSLFVNFILFWKLNIGGLLKVFVVCIELLM